ncbi:MAG: hypothetical protein K2P17_01365 [Helicobacteraceae bacterium]|nr:hypothetical protein [Helicobacteraceae bacterium]
MRFWQILAIALFFSGCANTISSLNGIDENIPVVKNVKVLADVSSIAFEWDIINDSEVSGFVLYRNGKGGFSEIAHIKNPNATHYVDENLVPETEYQYYFLTLSGNSYSPKSQIIKAKTSFINAVESIYASNDYVKKVKLLWSPHPNPSISHYLIQREIDGEFKTISLVNHRLLVEYFDDNLEDGKDYNYRIIAMDFNSTPSRPSSVITAKTKPRPDASERIYATSNLANKIIVSWDKGENIKQYKIFRSNDDKHYRFLSYSDTNEYEDIINIPNQIYFYKVSNIDENGLESELSIGVKGSTKNTPITPKIARGYVDDKEARLEWEENKNAKYFMVYRKDTTLGVQDRFRVKENYFIDKDMKVGNEYRYYVVAFDEFDLASSPSNEIVLSIK